MTLSDRWESFRSISVKLQRLRHQRKYPQNRNLCRVFVILNFCSRSFEVKTGNNKNVESV